MYDAPNTFEAQLGSVCASVRPSDPAFEAAAWERLDLLTKPPRSLGRLEEIASRIAGMQRTVRPDVREKAVLLMAADHGVVAQGVSAYPQSVTLEMVRTFARGRAAINQIASSVNARVLVYDVGVAGDTTGIAGIEHRNVARGTADMTLGPAMSREQCAQAVLVGVAAAREAAERGASLLGTGEMGIGNTTAAAALTATFTGAAPEAVVGRGTGLDERGVKRKADVVRTALDGNRVAELDPLGVLAAVGGLEIAALAGVVIGAAEEQTPVVVDGFVATAGALAAVALCAPAGDYLLPSHLSAEPGHRVALGVLGLKPLLELDMRLGEGTGAALAMGLADSACRMLSGMSTFSEAGVSAPKSEGS